MPKIGLPEKAMTDYVLGSELRVGDTIEVWWQPNRDTILSLVPYKGPLTCFEPHGAQLASFAISPTGMTIENGSRYTLISRQG